MVGGGRRLRLQLNLRPSRDTQRAQTKPCVHEDQMKGSQTPQETEPDLPLSV